MRRIHALLLAILCALAATLAAPTRALAGPSDGLPSETTSLDRATPRRAMQGFLDAARASDFVRAAHYLDLRGVPSLDQAREGPVLAQELDYVLEHKLSLDASALPDQPEGIGAGEKLVVVATILLDDEPVAIGLTHVRFDDGVPRWIVSRATVSMIPSLYGGFEARSWEDRIPLRLRTLHLLGNAAWQWIGLVFAICLSYIIGRFLGWILILPARAFAARTKTPWDDELVEAAKRPLRMVIAAIAFNFAFEPLHFTTAVDLIADRVSFSFLAIGIAWFLTGTIGVGARFMRTRLMFDPKDEVKNRGIRTQLAVMRRISSVMIVLVTTAVILLQFDFVRNVGMSLLASAGIAGIVFGLAAQKSLAGVIAGIQLSITQPVRLGDSIVIEGEFGVVEEINLTYVVVLLWDDRRLIVPIARFLEQPFANWTKVSAETTGAVTLMVDPTTPVEALRVELNRIVAEHPAWDQRRCSLQVIDMSDKGLTLRAVVSSIDSSKNWDLRCEVREKLVAFLDRLDGGRYFVRARGETIGPQLRPSAPDPTAGLSQAVKPA